jgi:hypothetical protein
MLAPRILSETLWTREMKVEEISLVPGRELVQGNHVAEAWAIQYHCVILSLLSAKVDRMGGGQPLQFLHGSAIQVPTEPFRGEGGAPDSGEHGPDTQADHPFEKGAPGLPPKWSFHVNPCRLGPFDDPTRESVDSTDVSRDDSREPLLAELPQGRLIRTRERGTNPEVPVGYPERCGLSANQAERVGLEIRPFWNKRHKFADF